MVNFCKFAEHFAFLPLIAMANIESWVGKTTRNPVKNTKKHFYRTRTIQKRKMETRHSASSPFSQRTDGLVPGQRDLRMLLDMCLQCSKIVFHAGIAFVHIHDVACMVRQHDPLIG